MNPISWIQALSVPQMETVLLGAIFLIIVLVLAFLREAPPDPFSNPGLEPFSEDVDKGMTREFLRHLGHLLLILAFFSCAWTYFTWCNDLWTSFCGFFRIPRLNVALIPAITVACWIFIRLVLLFRSVLEPESDTIEED